MWGVEGIYVEGDHQAKFGFMLEGENWRYA